jgi:magnesium chelatase subunit I
MRITSQEAWIERNGSAVPVPGPLREIVEEIAFAARESEFVDQNSGVSARLTISALENLVSNAERRSLLLEEGDVRPRICDLHNVLPSITGKIELVYEGEQEGTGAVARHIIGRAVKKVFVRHFPEAARLEADRDRDDTPFREVIDWFSGDRKVEVSDEIPTADYVKSLERVPGLRRLAERGLRPTSAAERGAAMELVLEGLHQFSMIAREDLDRGKAAYRDLLGEMMNQLGD